MTNAAETPRLIAEARTLLGHAWGFGRPLKAAELARALALSPVHGGVHVRRLATSRATLSGPVEVALRMMMAGHVPHTIGAVRMRRAKAGG